MKNCEQIKLKKQNDYHKSLPKYGNSELRDIVREFLIEGISKNRNPFNFKEDYLDKHKFATFSKKQKRNIMLKNEKIRKYHGYIHWYCKEYNLNKTKFLNEIEYHRFYTYAIIYNRIINDDSIKEGDREFIPGENSNYDTIFNRILSNYKYITFKELIENDRPIHGKYIHRYLQDLIGNYILPRIDEQYEIDSYYNLSQNFLKK